MKFLHSLLPLFAALLLASCVPEEYVLRISPKEKTPVRIAAILPLSSKASRIFAAQMREGICCAVDELNDKHGIAGREVEVKVFDSAGEAVQTAAAVREAVQWGACALIAGYATSEVDMILPLGAKMRLPMVIPLATADHQIHATPFAFRNSYTDSQQLEMLIAYAHFWRKLKRLAVFNDLASDDALYSRNICRAAAQAIRDFGGEVTGTIMLPADGSLPDRVFTEILKTTPEMILIPCSGKRAAAVLKKLRESGFSGVIIGPDSWQDEEFFDALAGCDPGDCIFTGFFSDENRSDEFLKFKARFRERYFHNPGPCETQSYDAVKLLAIALGSAGNLSEFDANWRTIRSHQGAAAVYTMLPKGEIDRTIYINTIGVNRSGEKLIPYERLSAKFQYSKIEEYSSYEEDSDDEENDSAR